MAKSKKTRVMCNIKTFIYILIFEVLAGIVSEILILRRNDRHDYFDSSADAN